MHTYELVVSTSMSSPTVPLFFMNITGDLKRIVALRTKIINRYEARNREHPAPHHSELVKNGWTFIKSGMFTEALIMEERLLRSTHELEGHLFDHEPTAKERDEFLQGLYRSPQYLSKPIIKEERVLEPTDPTGKDALEELQRFRERFPRGENIKNLMRLMACLSRATVTQIAELIGCEVSWITRTLGLDTKLESETLQLTLEGTIGICNGYNLKKLPLAEQGDYINRAIKMVPEEFHPLVMARAKEIRDAKRQAN